MHCINLRFSSVTLSSSVATRDNRSKLHSPLAAPSVRDSAIPKRFEFFAGQSDRRSSASNSDATRQYWRCPPLSRLGSAHASMALRSLLHRFKQA